MKTLKKSLVLIALTSTAIGTDAAAFPVDVRPTPAHSTALLLWQLSEDPPLDMQSMAAEKRCTTPSKVDLSADAGDIWSRYAAALVGCRLALRSYDSLWARNIATGADDFAAVPTPGETAKPSIAADAADSASPLRTGDSLSIDAGKAAPVPLPGSVWTLAGSLGVLGILLRRNRSGRCNE